MQVEEGEDGPVGEKGRSEDGWQALLDVRVTVVGEGARDVGGEDVGEGPT